MLPTAASTGIPEDILESAQAILPPSLFKKLEPNAERLDLWLITRAYEFSKLAHAGQKRHSGEDYVVHCEQVAEILADPPHRSVDALDDAGHLDTAILAYSTKYASAYYGPFREAVDSSLTGDRRTYQQDGRRTGSEGVREALLDIEEGADIVMVKPALAYLDVLRQVADVAHELGVPTAAYNISGEYSMLEAAAANGWIDREPAILETLTSIRRAGADIILTYWAVEAARLL